MAALSFDSTKIEIKNNDFSPLPAGEYVAQIRSTEIKPTKAGGTRLVLQWEIIDGPTGKGRIVFDSLNLQHQTSPTAESIGQETLAKICQATGMLKLSSTEQLHGKPCKIRVDIEKDDKYGDKNIVKKYAPIAGMAPKFAANNGGGAPWAKAAA